MYKFNLENFKVLKGHFKTEKINKKVKTQTGIL